MCASVMLGQNSCLCASVTWADIFLLCFHLLCPTCHLSCVCCQNKGQCAQMQEEPWCLKNQSDTSARFAFFLLRLVSLLNCLKSSCHYSSCSRLPAVIIFIRKVALNNDESKPDVIVLHQQQHASVTIAATCCLPLNLIRSAASYS